MPVTVGDDCDDANPGVYPGATETCNTTDDDCDGTCDGASCRVGVHRSVGGGEHFYTTSAAEAACCGFTVEFYDYYRLYTAQLGNLIPFYRCALFGGKHLYTADVNCEGAGTNEGAMGYIAPSPICGSTPLYRLYYAATGDHFYTTSDSERASAIAGGHVDEGTVGYVW